MSRSAPLAGFLLLSIACASGPSKAHLDSISAELVEMERVDQESRNAWIEADKKKEGDPAKAEELRKHVVDVDRANSKRLSEILAEIGWPRRTQVGEKASHAAWLIAQHTSDRELQAHVLEILKPLLEQGEVSKPSFALLDDRVRCHRGEPQIYGTQYSIKRVDGVVHFGPLTPIADPEHLEERRRAMGLEPHAEYVAALRKMYGVGDDAVVDP